jgi:hypothetical protein
MPRLLTDADVPVSSHFEYGPGPDWSTKVEYFVRHNENFSPHPTGTGQIGLANARKRVAELQRIGWEGITVFARTVLASPQREIALDD